MADLPEPHFVDREPGPILAACIAQYEAAAGRSLQPAQVERLIIDLLVYEETLCRQAIQDAAKQNLLAFARYPMIDLLAQIVGAARLPATAARCPIAFTVTPTGSDRTAPAGTRVRTADRRAIFALDADVIIDADAASGAGWATCEAAGVIGNGYAPGQVKELVAPLPFTATVANTATSAGGTASEDTERLRTRIPTVLDALAAAGPRQAYRAIALGAHQDVVDVAVSNPTSGTVRLAVLVRAGGDAESVLDAVEAAADAEDVRPLTDTVVVVEADDVPYTLTAVLTLLPGLSGDAQAAALAAAQASAAAFVAARASRLGVGVPLSAAYVAVSVANVASAAVELDWSGVGDVTVDADEWANCTSVEVTLA